MNDSATVRQNALRAVRLIHGIMLVMTLVYAFMAEQLAPGDVEGAPDGVILIAMIVVAVLDVLIALYFRMKFVTASAGVLRTHPEDAESLKRWRSGSIVVSVLCLTVALYGFVLRFIGFGPAQSLPFYALAAILLLLWWPRLEL